MNIRPEIIIRNREVLSDDWATLTRYTLDYRRADGSWQPQIRQVYDRGDGAALLPYDPVRETVLLTRQFRLPAHVTGHAETLIELCAGKLDADDPATCIRKEAEEELGLHLATAVPVFQIYMSPGSVSERLHFFLCRYRAEDLRHAGGGDASEGEEIAVLELPRAEALAMIRDGRIIDGKTIMLLYHLALYGLPEGA
jgi:nudix-type nucleoside diphosphatase (YffH/AdpP family)